MTANLAAAGMGIHVGQTISASLGEFCPGRVPARESIDLHVVGIVTDTVGIEAEVGVSIRALHATGALSAWARSRELERELVRGRPPGRGQRRPRWSSAPGLPVALALSGDDLRARDTARRVPGRDRAAPDRRARAARHRPRPRTPPRAHRARVCTTWTRCGLSAAHGAISRRWARSTAPPFAALALPVAALIAVAASTLTPVGDAGQFEPSRGTQVDLLVLGFGSALFVATVIALSAASATIAGRRQDRFRQRPSIIGTAGHAGVPPAGLLGLRLAFEGSGGRRVSIAGRVVAQVVAVAVLVGAVTFSAGLAHLDRSPRLLGWNWDAMGSVATTSRPRCARTRTSNRPPPGRSGPPTTSSSGWGRTGSRPGC